MILLLTTTSTSAFLLAACILLLVRVGAKNAALLQKEQTINAQAAALEERHHALIAMQNELTQKERDIIDVIDNPHGIAAKKYRAQKAIRDGQKALAKSISQP